jgi:hypothetical protein
MTGLLVVTFVIAGLHTLLWLPRSLQWRRKLKSIQSSEENNPLEPNPETDKDKSE